MAAGVREKRKQILAAAYAVHPERFVKGRPQPAELPQVVWINPPDKKTTLQDAPEGSTIVTLDDPRVDSVFSTCGPSRALTSLVAEGSL